MLTDALYWISERLSDTEGFVLLLFILAAGIALVFHLRKKGTDEESGIGGEESPYEELPPPALGAPRFEVPATPGFFQADDPAGSPAAPAAEGSPGPLPGQEGESALAPPVRYRLRSREIREAFQGKVPRVGVSPFYFFWMLVVTGAVILLPLVYFGLIGAVAAGVYYYAFVARETIFSAGVNRLTLMAFIIPLLAGLGVLLFMVSPLFALFSRRQTKAPVELDPAREPLVFCLVEEICKAVGSPIPKKVYVDWDVNASAGMRRGIWSVLAGGDLVLTIGLPLVAAMNMNQLAGVLAHEFGHFKQGTGMALSYVIRSVNRWFAMLVYRPEGWDQASDPDGETSVVELAIRLCIAITRGILWVFLMAAHGVSSALLRQQEYDADRHEALLAGGHTFADTTFLFPQLHAAASLSFQDLRRAMQRCKGRPALADNFPALLLNRLDQLPEALREKVIQADLERKTGLFDTHPAAQARLDMVNRLEAPGLFHLDRPATDLFAHFDELCSEVTFDLYRSALGPLVQKDILIPNEEFLERYGERIPLPR